MMDVYRCIDPDVVMFDFAVLHDGAHFFDREVLEKGSEKYLLPDPRAGLLKNYRALVRFFREHPFQAVHTHVSWYSGIVLLAARQAGVKIRIAHARTAAIPNQSLAKRLVRNLGQLLIAASATERFAISEEAAEFIFGKGVVKKGGYQYVPNAIDQKKYAVLKNGRKKGERTWHKLRKKKIRLSRTAHAAERQSRARRILESVKCAAKKSRQQRLCNWKLKIG